ncbi:MAG: TIGR04053 family radical SAM/SPASM domain-containing protein [Chloroflexaceae bacterium]|nr:TIGR04053 family radical SAM/SPASM domain-containing protein [Chloroflexaceae bacterium]
MPGPGPDEGHLQAEDGAPPHAHRLGLIRQPVYDLNERPFIVVWETTQACDLACRHCRMGVNDAHDPQILSFEEGCRLMDQVLEFGKPRPIFIMTGGDPFKREDLFDLIRYGAERGILVAVSPSGTPLLNAENIRRIKEAGARAMSLSIDGSNAAIHDDFRRVPGVFERTVEGWKIAREVGIKVQINTTVTRYNLFDLPHIFRLAYQIGAMTWSLFFLVPTGRALSEDEISPEDYEAVMNFLYDASKFISAKTVEGHHYKRIVVQRAALEIKGLPPEPYMHLNETYHRLRDHLDQMVREENLPPPLERIRRAPMHINSGNGFVFVSQRGDVYPCGYLPIQVGNVRQQSLSDIYRDSPVMRSLRDRSQLTGRCGVCEFYSLCSGSRSRAYAMTGDVLSEEQFCIYQPGSFPFVNEAFELSGVEA